MIQIKVESKDSHGGYRIYDIYESEAECLAFGKTIVTLSGRICDLKAPKENGVPTHYVMSVEGHYVPLLKVLTIGRYNQTFVFFPRLRHNIKKKHFSYNVDFASKYRFRLTYNEKLFAAFILSGLSAVEAAQRTWTGKNDNYWYITIRNIFNRRDFIEYIFEYMSIDMKSKLAERGINKDKMADILTELITGEKVNTVTGETETVKVPQNLRLWALNSALNIMEAPAPQQNQGTNHGPNLPNQAQIAGIIINNSTNNGTNSRQLNAPTLSPNLPSREMQLDPALSLPVSQPG